MVFEVLSPLIGFYGIMIPVSSLVRVPFLY